jgi:hypothetical protein
MSPGPGRASENTGPTNEGRMEAKTKGVKFGRKPTVDKAKVCILHRQKGLVRRKSPGS